MTVLRVNLMCFEQGRLTRDWELSRYIEPGMVPRVGEWIVGEAETLEGDDQGREYQVTAVFWNYDKHEVVVQVK